MGRKLAYFSQSQLLLLELLLENKDRAMGVIEISHRIKFKGESLGGLISSLARNKFHGNALIEPWGRDNGGVGMRWKINSKTIDLEISKKEVKRLLEGYKK